MPLAAIGGRVIGRGRWGDVLNVAPSPSPSHSHNETDGQTMKARMTGPTVQVFVRSSSSTTNRSSSSSRTYTVSSERLHRFLQRHQSQLVAKFFTASSERVRREGFLRELRVNAKIYDIYQKNRRSASRFTAIASLDVNNGLPGMTGVVMKNQSALSDYAILARRCDKELARVQVRSGTTDTLVTQVLASLRVLHDAGMLHADIHESNIMLCGTHFKLVDWEKSVSIRSLMQDLHMGDGSSIQSIRSPLFALVTPSIARLSSMGSTKLASIAALSVVTAWSTFRLTKLVIQCPSMRAALGGIAESFVSFVAAGNSQQPFTPIKFFRRNVCSVDLFAFGIVLFSTLCKPGIERRESAAQLRRVHALAVRLTHYGHPEFVGDSAGRAHRMYTAWDPQGMRDAP